MDSSVVDYARGHTGVVAVEVLLFTKLASKFILQFLQTTTTTTTATTTTTTTTTTTWTTANTTTVYRSPNTTAPSYLAADLRSLSDMPSRRRLQSSLTH